MSVFWQRFALSLAMYCPLCMWLQPPWWTMFSLALVTQCLAAVAIER